MVKDKQESDVMVESLSFVWFNSREMTPISAYVGFLLALQEGQKTANAPYML